MTYSCQALSKNSSKHKSDYDTKNSILIAENLIFNQGYKGLFTLKLDSDLQNLPKNYDLKIHFSNSFFVDLDDIYRQILDTTSSLFQVDIDGSRYPIDIEQPAWLEQEFFIEIKNLDKKLIEFPVNLRYHRSNLEGQAENLKNLENYDEPYRLEVCHNSQTQFTLDSTTDLSETQIPVGKISDLEQNLGLTLATILLSCCIILKGLFR